MMPFDKGILNQVMAPGEGALTPVMFLGENAQGADLQGLAKAKALAEKGRDQNSIFFDTMPKNPNATGWFQGPDSKWRYEIDDSKATVNEDVIRNLGTNSTTIGKVLNHPELFKAYPDLANMKFRLVDQQGLGGYYDPKNNEIALNLNTRLRDSMLHEVQHAVQNRAGFANGSSPMLAPMGLAAPLYDQQDVLDAQHEQMVKGTGPYANMAPNDRMRQASDMQRQINTFGNQVNSYLDKVGKTEPFELYQRYAGETEARNVENRSKFDPALRRREPPWVSQDYPNSMQFVPGMLSPFIPK